MTPTFKVHRVDEIGARVSHMNAPSFSGDFPQRVATSTDFYAAEELMKPDSRVNIDLPSGIAEIVRQFSAAKLNSMLNPTSFSKEKKTVNKIANKMGKRMTMLCAMIPRETPITEELNRKLLLLQGDLGAISVHDSVTLSPQALENRITNSIRFLADQGLEEKKVITVRMQILQKREVLRKKIELALDNSDGIAFRFTAPDAALQWYNIIKQFNEAERWLHLSAVPKTWDANDTSSLIQLMKIFGFDSLSPLTRRIPFKPKVIITKRFDYTTLGVLNPLEHQKRYGDDPNCKTNCPVDNGLTYSEQLSNYNPEEMIGRNRVHAVFDEQFKFAEDGVNILKGNGSLLNDYISREFGREPAFKFLGLDPKQRHI